MPRPRTEKMEVIAACVASGLSVSEIVEVTGYPHATVVLYSWAVKRPDKYKAWRERGTISTEAIRKERIESGACTKVTFWAMERLATLKQLLASELSFSECAERIGNGCTRNMVAGICYRMGWRSLRPAPQKGDTRLLDMVRDGLARGMNGREIANFYQMNQSTATVYASRIRRQMREAVRSGADAT